MNIIDRIVNYVAPMTGVKRAQARLALDMVRAYDAAKITRQTQGWQTGGGSANAEVVPAMLRVRNRSRDIARNNEFGRNGIRALVTNTVGDGITAKAPDQDLWNYWCEDECDADGQLDFNGIIELAARHRYTDGEVLIRLRPRLPEDGLKVPLQLQVLEADHLDESKTGVLANGNVAIAGVEFNAIGQRVAYWLYPVHPGEVAGYRLRALESRRVPAENIIHYYRKERASQVRGMSELAVSIMRMRDLSDYEQAELVRKKIEACFVAFVRTDNQAEQLGGAMSATAAGQKQEKIAPGMIKYLSNTDGVDFGSPSQSGGYGEYTSTQLHAIAAGIGVMYSQMTGDLSNFNYSSYRAGLVEFRQMIKAEQWNALVPMVLRPIARQFQIAARLSGAQRVPIARMPWTMPKLPWVDPLKDVMAAKEAHRGTIKSISESIRESGEDPDAVFAEIAAERKTLKALGILTDSDAAVSERLVSGADFVKKDDSKD